MLTRIFFFICTILFGHQIFCDSIQTSLRSIQLNPNKHSMKNIDCVYMINLDERPEKFNSCQQQLSPYHIVPYRFSAVNGWKLSHSTINALGVFGTKDVQPILATYFPLLENQAPEKEVMNNTARGYFYPGMTKGAIGIVLSHLSVLSHALQQGFSTIWVMEDDIEVLQNPHILSSLIEKLDRLVGKAGWDVLFTDVDTKNKKGERVPCAWYAPRPNFTPKCPERFAMRQQISSEFRKIGARYGAYSMIIRKSGIKKILNFILAHKIFLPYDMDYYLPENINLFTVVDDVVSTQISPPTDNERPGYKEKIK